MSDSIEARLARMEERQLAQGELLGRLLSVQDVQGRTLQTMREERATEAGTLRGALAGGRLAAGLIGGAGGAALLRLLEGLHKAIG